MRSSTRGPVLGAIAALVVLLVPSAKSQGQLQVGYSTLTPDGGSVAPIGAAIFSYTNSNGVLVSQAGVGATAPTRSGRIFVDQAGSATGIAMVNPSSTVAEATLTLRDAAGRTIGTPQVRSLRAGEHISAYVSELFGQVAAGIRGSLTFDSDQALAAIAIRESRNVYGEPLYATLPVSDLLSVAASTPLSFPHIAAGDGYTTQLVLVNTTATTISGQVRFTNDSGTPLALSVNGTLMSDVFYSIQPQGTYLAEVTSTALAVGAATVTPNFGDATPAGTAIFRYGLSGNLMTEAAAYATATKRSRMVVDYLGTQTGVAIANPATTSAVVTFSLMDRFGNVSETASRNVAGSGHLATFVHELFPDVADSFSGLLDIASTTPVAPVTLKLTNNLRGDLILTTLPVADLTAAATQTQVVFPHIALGDGWRTQLILVNADPTRAATGRIAFADSLGVPLVTSMSGQTAAQFSYQIVAGGGRRFVPGNSATVASALAIDLSTNRVTTEVTVNTGNTVALPLVMFDSTGAVRDDFDATVVSTNPDVATATAAGLVGKRAGFSTLAVAVGSVATTVTATVVDVQAGPAGFQPTGVVQDLAQRVYLSSSTDSAILLAQDLRSVPATYAGMRQSPGFTNDLRLQSRFRNPSYMVLHQSDGSLFVADTGNNVIRRVSPGSTGRVETFAGSGTAGSQDGPLLQASFNNPQGIALDGRGGLWVVDSGNHTIRRIRLQTGIVETIAGLPGASGLADGSGTAARFNGPVGIAVELETLAQQLARQQAGTPVPPVSLVVADTGNGRLRRVNESGEVSTIALIGGAASTVTPSRRLAASPVSAPLTSTSPTGVAVDPSGNIYFTEPDTRSLKLILTNGSLVAGAQRNTFTSPKGIAISTSGTVVVADGAQSAREIVFGEPDITSVSPGRVSAAGGQPLVIQGHNFSPESIVIIGGVLATNVRVDNTERISVTTPPAPSGLTTITVQNRAGLAQTSLVIDAVPLSALPAGYITTFAGGNTFLGDGGKATSAYFVASWRIAVDSSGNIYVADLGAHRVRKIAASTGIITTVAGTGQSGFSGDDQPATAAALSSPNGLAVDGAGNIFISDTGNNRVRKVSAATGLITTIGGGGTGSGDGVVATSALLLGPSGLSVDSAGNVFVAELFRRKIRRIDSATGIITTVAGTGVVGDGGDGGLATAATLRDPNAVVVASNGDLYIAGINGTYRVRKVSAATGFISTVMGTGTAGRSEGSGPGTSFAVGDSLDLAVDQLGNLIVADIRNGRILQLDTSTLIVSIVAAYAAQGIAAGAAETILALGTSGTSVVKIDTRTGARTLLGGGVSPPVVGSGSPTAIQLRYPGGVAIDASDNVFIADYNSLRVLRVSASGMLTSMPAPGPSAVAMTPGGKAIVLAGVGVYELTPSDGVLRKIAGGTTFPGNFLGDGGPAINAEFNNPLALCVDRSGNIYIADTGNGRVRKINAQTGFIATVAGNGQAGNTGDNGLAINAPLSSPIGVATDGAGNLFILTTGRIRKVDVDTGIITTVTIVSPISFAGIVVDQANNIFVSATFKILKVSATTGAVTTIAGRGEKGYSGDGGAAIDARFNFGGTPALPGLALDSAGNLYISDTLNNRVRVIKGPIP